MAQWNIDPDHSVAGFSIRHMMVADVRGTITGITGTILFHPDALERSSVEASMPLSGLTTGNRKRDEHLFSADFFEAERFPSITFRSTKVEKTGSNRARVTGELAIHGITKAVAMDAEYFGPVKSPADIGGETVIGFFASLTINREDFGIMWNVPLGGDNLMAGREVRITLDIEADLAE
jgi:polyisoprenoid-binding protein YceI